MQLQSQHNLEAMIWSSVLGCFLLRFMTLGTKINRKYRSISVLITEQINLYLQVMLLYYLVLRFVHLQPPQNYFKKLIVHCIKRMKETNTNLRHSPLIF